MQPSVSQQFQPPFPQQGGQPGMGRPQQQQPQPQQQPGQPPLMQSQRSQPLFAAPSATPPPAATSLQFYQSNYNAPSQPQGSQGSQGSQGWMQPTGQPTGQPQPQQTGQQGWLRQPTAFQQPPPQPSSQVDPQNRVFVGSPWGTAGYADELPLAEELGVNFSHIYAKTLSVLNVTKPPDKHIMDDADLAGPIVFCILFGAFLLLSGKVHFGYIYGVATFGCIAMYCFLNLMSETGVDVMRTASVLGYCLLPMVVLSVVATLLNLTGMVGMVLSGLSVCWCTYSSSTMFVTVLSMKDQRMLVAYPVGLLYTSFALLTVF